MKFAISILACFAALTSSGATASERTLLRKGGEKLVEALKGDIHGYFNIFIGVPREGECEEQLAQVFQCGLQVMTLPPARGAGLWITGAGKNTFCFVRISANLNGASRLSECKAVRSMDLAN